MAERSKKWIIKDRKFAIAILANTVEGLLAGSVLGAIFIAIQLAFLGQYESRMLLFVSLIVAMLFLVRFVLYSFAYTVSHIGGAVTAKNMRLYLGDKIKCLPLLDFSRNSTGHYINIVTNDINQYENILTHKAGDITKNVAMIGFVLAFLTTVNPIVGALNAAFALLLIPAVWLSFKAVKKYGGIKKKSMVDHVSHVVEYISGIQTFRSYGMAGKQNKQVNQALKHISEISYIFEAKVIPIGSVFSILLHTSIPISIIVSGYQWLAGNISSPDMVLCMILPLFVVRIIEILFIDFTAYKNLLLSKQTMDSLAYAAEEAGSDEEFVLKEFTVCFEQVSFGYDDDQPIFEGLNFTANTGQLTAIVGESGSGKTTILNLISKFYQAQSGSVSIGGISINDIRSERVLRHISMVYQDVFLFNDTIKNNIAFAHPKATDDQIIEACKQANCHQFITELENGYDTVIGENGSRLSGGERQRISIARAILRESPIILLDEATSSLDIENELAVKQAILRLVEQKKTVIMIAHNLSVIRHADHILVMAKGKIVERGAHQQLIDLGGKYASMWRQESYGAC